jgi:hypothetical protein
VPNHKFYQVFRNEEQNAILTFKCHLLEERYVDHPGVESSEFSALTKGSLYCKGLAFPILIQGWTNRNSNVSNNRITLQIPINRPGMLQHEKSSPISDKIFLAFIKTLRRDRDRFCSYAI